jgi:hypothetical protein
VCTSLKYNKAGLLYYYYVYYYYIFITLVDFNRIIKLNKEGDNERRRDITRKATKTQKTKFQGSESKIYL